MSKNVLIIEDLFGDFASIHDICKHNSCTPFPNKDEKEFNEFLDLILAYLKSLYNSDDTTSDENNIINYLNNFQPDLIISDYGLLDTQEFIDETGGEFRTNFLAKYFPNTQVLFFSVYSDESIKSHRKETDGYINKDKGDNIYIDIFKSWEDRLGDYLINFFE